MNNSEHQMQFFALALLTSVLILPGISPDLFGQNSSDATRRSASESESSDDESHSRAELLKELQNKIKTLQNIREKKFQAQQRLNRTIQNEVSKRNTLKNELKQLRDRKTETKQKLEKAKKRVTTLKSKRKRLRTSIDKLTSSVTSLRDALSNHIDHTAPYHLSRRMEPVKSATSASMQDDPVSTLRNLLDQTRNELSAGTSSELFHARVPLSNEPSPRKKHAQLVRIGQNTLFFVTEDGKQAGYYVYDDGEWKVKQASNDQKKRFQRSIKIIQEHERPARVPLPVIMQKDQQ